MSRRYKGSGGRACGDKMSGFGQEQKDLVFQDCLGLCSGAERQRAAQLRALEPQAASSGAAIDAALAPLRSISPQACPDELAEHTLERLRELTRRHLDAVPPPARRIKLGRGRNVGNLVAVAAAILLVVGILIPSSRLMRHRYYVQMCAGQFSNLFRGLEQYSADHDDMFPALARAADAPWNRIGWQGPENHSNTRSLFSLLKHRYVDRPEEFICCGSARDQVLPLTPAQIATHRDFPSRDSITYSYRVTSHPSVKKTMLAALPIMADMNPHFERQAACTAAGMPLHSVGHLVHLNSMNHGRRGQNVLFGGGYVRYSKARLLGEPLDDIYTTEDSDECDGHEVPQCLTDTLLGP